MACIEMTYEIAMACFKDAADRNMRKHGRKAWNEDDYNVGVETFDRLYDFKAAREKEGREK